MYFYRSYWQQYFVQRSPLWNAQLLVLIWVQHSPVWVFSDKVMWKSFPMNWVIESPPLLSHLPIQRDWLVRLQRTRLPPTQLELFMMSRDSLVESKISLQCNRFTDSTIQYDRKFLPFEIVDRDGKPYIQVEKGT